MLTQKIARRPIVIGPTKLEAGDVLDEVTEALLPPGRLKVLVAGGWFREQPVAASDDVRITELEARLEALEARLATHEHAGRPPKESE